ncbi:hypothetical protein NMA510612_1354 [Neisseria meningitidis]|uniref:Uncharacterized protein n=3 Tax=Neisseria meningitidis TaxID=487 RepID=X5ERK0_NEIME|nr:hypothetical protein NMA510612_1354 [Neisseria meningitidis]CAM08412.1 hypothetical protein NMA1214 [Neisseria meningitidis Z2491]CBA05645.1 hypothetical protein NMO_0913 [Neisseria meningitidis alpha14]
MIIIHYKSPSLRLDFADTAYPRKEAMIYYPAVLFQDPD